MQAHGLADVPFRITSKTVLGLTAFFIPRKE